MAYEIFTDARQRSKLKIILAQGYDSSMGITEEEFNHIQETIDIKVSFKKRIHDQHIYKKLTSNGCIPPGWVRKVLPRTGPSLEWVKDTFSADPDTGIVTYKKIRLIKKDPPLFPTVDTPQSGGYLSCVESNEDGKLVCLLAHRLAYMIYHDTDIPKGMVIDHIDQNRTNNKKDNLRLVSRSGNSRNRAMNRNNTSGYRNIRWVSGPKLWLVTLSHENQRYSKYFKTLEEALEYRTKLIMEVVGEEYLKDIDEESPLHTGERYIYFMNNDLSNPYYFINVAGKTAATRDLNEAIKIRDKFLQENNNE